MRHQNPYARPALLSLITLALIATLSIALLLASPAAFAILSSIYLATIAAPWFLLFSALTKSTAVAMAASILFPAAYLFLLITFIATKPRSRSITLTFIITTIIYTLALIASGIIMLVVLDAVY